MIITPGTRINHYEVVSQLGAGGMGEVYLAEDPRLNRRVAIKMLPDEFARDSDRLRRFEQEARATSALNHPNILTVFDIGNHEGSPYIVCELLEGQELRCAWTNERWRRARRLSTPNKLSPDSRLRTNAASRIV